MQEHQQKIIAPKTDNALKGASETAGMTLSPPQFKMEASQLKAQETAEAGGNPETAHAASVCNVASITRQIQNCAPDKNVYGIAASLEKLKHDPGNVAYFRQYFATKVGQGFEEYLATYIGQESAAIYNGSLDHNTATYAAAEVAESFHAFIEAGELNELSVLMSFMADVPGTTKAYKTLYPGRDLYTDIVAASTEEFDLSYLAKSVFGKTQSNEQVMVKNAEEAQEAREIIARIYDKYGVLVNSQASVDEILDNHPSAPAELRAQIKTASWTMEELRTLEQSLAKFAPFMGPRPTNYETYEAPRLLETVGRVNTAMLTSKSKVDYVAGNVGGEAFYSDQSVALFDNMKSQGYADRYQSQKKDPESGAMVDQNKNPGMGTVMVHEFGHALLHNHLEAFKKVGGYWKTSVDAVPTTKFTDPKNNYPISEFKDTGNPAIEAPITDYGCGNAEEDLAETVALYLNNPDLLKNGHPSWHKLPATKKHQGITGNPCPKRYAFIHNLFEAQKKVQK